MALSRNEIIAQISEREKAFNAGLDLREEIATALLSPALEEIEEALKESQELLAQLDGSPNSPENP